MSKREGFGRGRRRALFVINSLAGGGAERVFTTLVRHSEEMRDRYAITVALLDNEAVEAYTLPDWVKVIRLNSGGSLFKSIARLCVFARQWRPDVILSFLTRANIAGVFAGRIANSTVLISERVNTTAHLAKGRFASVSRALVRLTYPRANAVVAVSNGVRTTLISDFGVPEGRVRVVDNPVDLKTIRELGARPDDLLATQHDWVTMGRLVSNKNAALAIRAFAKTEMGGRLFVLGDGAMREELGSLAAGHGVGDRVIFGGFRSNPYATIARCRGYILPSNAEGFPNAMVEAMALGVPVVATDCPSGPAEILQTSLASAASSEGRGGILVPCNDSGAMAEAMVQLADETRRARLARAAFERVDDYSIQKSVNRFWEVIGELVPQ